MSKTLFYIKWLSLVVILWAPSNMKLLGHGRCLGDCLLSKWALAEKNLAKNTWHLLCLWKKKCIWYQFTWVIYLQIMLLISPTPPPFGVTNSINERFFKNVFFSFLLILGCLKIKSQRLASSQQKFKQSQDTQKNLFKEQKYS